MSEYEQSSTIRSVNQYTSDDEQTNSIRSHTLRTPPRRLLASSSSSSSSRKRAMIIEKKGRKSPEASPSSWYRSGPGHSYNLGYSGDESDDKSKSWSENPQDRLKSANARNRKIQLSTKLRPVKFSLTTQPIFPKPIPASGDNVTFSSELATDSYKSDITNIPEDEEHFVLAKQCWERRCKRRILNALQINTINKRRCWKNGVMMEAKIWIFHLQVTFSTWQSYLKTKLELREKIVKAKRLKKICKLDFAVNQWKIYIIRRRSKHMKEQKADKYFFRLQAQRTWDILKKKQACMERQRKDLCKVIHFHLTRVKVKGFNAWLDAYNTNRKINNFRSEYDSRNQKRVVANYFNVWQELWQEGITQREICERNYNRQLKEKVFYEFKCNCEMEARRKETKLTYVKQKRNRNLSRRFLLTWLVAARSFKELNLEEARYRGKVIQRKAQRVIRNWRDSTLRERAIATKMHEFTVKRNQGQLYVAIHSWHRKAWITRAIAKLSERNSQRIVFSNWLRLSREVNKERESIFIADDFHRQRLLNRIFRDWANYTTTINGILEVRAEAHYNRSLVRATFRWWQEHVYLKRKDPEMMEKAGTQMRRSVVNFWTSYAKRKVLYEKCRRLVKKQTYLATLGYFHHWCRLTSEVGVTRDAIAYSFHRKRILIRAFESWQYFAVRQKRLRKTSQALMVARETHLLKIVFKTFTRAHQHINVLYNILNRYHAQKNREATARAIAVWRKLLVSSRVLDQALDWAAEWYTTRGLREALKAFCRNKEYRQMQKKSAKSAKIFRKHNAVHGLFSAAKGNIKKLKTAMKMNQVRTCSNYFKHWHKISLHNREVRECEEWLFGQQDTEIKVPELTSQYNVEQKEFNGFNLKPFNRPAPRIPSQIRNFAEEQMWRAKHLQESKELELRRMIASQIQLISQEQQIFRHRAERLQYLRKRVKSAAEMPAAFSSTQIALDQGEVEYLENVCNRYLAGSGSRKTTLEHLQRELAKFDDKCYQVGRPARTTFRSY